MKRILKNRTLIGVLCILIAIIICYGLTPLFNSAVTARGDIVRVSTNIRRGDAITSDMLETVNVGTYNLPTNLLTTRDDIVGRYALADLHKGDYILSDKISESPLAEFVYLSSLDGTKQAMSVTIKSFAAGLSGKLEAGDIVTLIAADYGDRRETSLPPELQYVYVLAVTAGSGNDKEYTTQDQQNNDDERELPSTITVLVDPIQSVLLADLEAKARLHASLVFRGPKKEAQKFLDAQDEYIASLTVDELTDMQDGGTFPEGLDAALSQDMHIPETPILPDAIYRGE